MHFDNDDIPDGIVWMSLSMRKLLLRYGDILSLDAQKRQFNNMGWPYIGPVVKTNDNTIRCVAESVVIAENAEMYEWVLKSMSEMEPKWSLSNIKIIFADGLIKQTLLTRLKISDTCVLRGDYYHLMHEVFPKSHNFGELVFACISKYLRNMLISKTVDEWENSYKSAALV